MFNFRRNENDVDNSLFDPEQDMDLVVMIEQARTEREIQMIVRMSRARMRARRKELEAARRTDRHDSGRSRAFAPPKSLLRGF